MAAAELMEKGKGHSGKIEFGDGHAQVDVPVEGAVKIVSRKEEARFTIHIFCAHVFDTGGFFIFW